MKLLICTQIMDKTDPTLGFFVSWVQEFARHFENITVVCLRKGEFDVPTNVRVFSLGKEENVPPKTYHLKPYLRLRYILRFKRFIWRERRNYNVVFVHMNAEYMVLGGLLWRLLGKKAALWYNHPAKHWRVRLGAWLANRIFYTSTHSYTARFVKACKMPVGIDTALFKKNIATAVMPGSILSLGRISVYKRIHVLFDGFRLLHDKGIQFKAFIYGNAPPLEAEYAARMREKGGVLEEAGIIEWRAGVSHTQTPALFNTHTIFVNSSQSGNFDKTILEAMACEATVLTSNPVLKDVLPPECFFEEDNAVDFAAKVAALLDLSKQQRDVWGKDFRAYVEKEHTLNALGGKLRAEFGYL